MSPHGPFAFVLAQLPSFSSRSRAIAFVLAALPYSAVEVVNRRGRSCELLMDHFSVQRLSDRRLRGRSWRELVAACVMICLDFRDHVPVEHSDLERAAWSPFWGRACRAGTQAAEARPVLLLHCTAEVLCSRWTGDAGHHPALQAGETAQQLALPGLHHWCTAVLSAPREGP